MKTNTRFFSSSFLTKYSSFSCIKSSLRLKRTWWEGQ